MRRGAGTCPPPSGKSSVSSSTTWKPLNTSFLPLLPSVCSSAGLQETTVVVNCARGIENKPDPSPQATGTESPSAPCSTRRPPPAPPHAPSPSQPYLAGVAVPLTPECHRHRLPGRGKLHTLERRLADGEPRGTIFTAGASLLRRIKRAKDGGWLGQIYCKRDLRFAICKSSGVPTNGAKTLERTRRQNKTKLHAT